MSGRSSASSAAARLIARGAVVVFAGTAVGAVLRYGFQVAVARRLGAAAFGLWTLGFVVFKIAAMAAEFGLPQGIVRHVAAFRGEGREAEAGSIIHSGLRLGLLTGSAAAILALALAAPVAGAVFRRPELGPVIRLFAAALPAATLTTVLLSVTQSFKTMVPTILVREVIEPLARGLFVAAAFLAGLEIAGATLAYILAAFAAAAAAWAALRRLHLKPVGAGLRPGSGRRLLLAFGWPLFIAQALSFITQWTGMLLLGLFRAPSDVGIYGAALKTVLLGSLSRNAFHSIYSPVAAEMDGRGSLASMGETYRTVSKWVFSLNFPLFLGLALFKRPVMSLFGEEFGRGSSVLAVLGLGWIVYSMVGPVGETLVMTGRQRLQLFNMGGSFAAALGLGFLLVPRLGPLGAAAATSASMGLYSAAAVLQVRFLVGLRPFSRTLWKPAAAGLLAASALFAAGRLPSLSPIFRELPAGLAGGAAFGLLYAGLLLLFGLDEQDRRIWERLKSRIISVRPGSEDDLP